MQFDVPLNRGYSIRAGWKPNVTIAQGNALGIKPLMMSPCKGKRLSDAPIRCMKMKESFALTGRKAHGLHITQGVALSYRDIGLSARTSIHSSIHELHALTADHLHHATYNLRIEN